MHAPRIKKSGYGNSPLVRHCKGLLYFMAAMDFFVSHCITRSPSRISYKDTVLSPLAAEAMRAPHGLYHQRGRSATLLSAFAMALRVTIELLRDDDLFNVFVVAAVAPDRRLKELDLSSHFLKPKLDPGQRWSLGEETRACSLTLERAVGASGDTSNEGG